MARGIPLTDPIRRARLISYEIHNSEIEFVRTLLLVSAMLGKENTGKLLEEYENLMFNTKKSKESAIRANEDLLKREAERVYEITKILDD